MKKTLSYTQWEFVAKYLGDISKAVFAVALASKFFGDMPLWLRIILGTVGVLTFIGAVNIVPKGEKS